MVEHAGTIFTIMGVVATLCTLACAIAAVAVAAYHTARRRALAASWILAAGMVVTLVTSLCFVIEDIFLWDALGYPVTRFISAGVTIVSMAGYAIAGVGLLLFRRPAGPAGGGAEVPHA